MFSQFVQMLKILEKDCRHERFTHMLTGETKDRQEVVNAFQNPRAPAYSCSASARPARA